MRMEELKMITPTEAKKALGEPLPLGKRLLPRPAGELRNGRRDARPDRFFSPRRSSIEAV